MELSIYRCILYLKCCSLSFLYGPLTPSLSPSRFVYSNVWSFRDCLLDSVCYWCFVYMLYSWKQTNLFSFIKPKMRCTSIITRLVYELILLLKCHPQIIRLYYLIVYLYSIWYDNCVLQLVIGNVLVTRKVEVVLVSGEGEKYIRLSDKQQAEGVEIEAELVAAVVHSHRAFINSHTT